MAGSQQKHSTVPSCADPILAARLEAIKQLAGGVSERVAVLDRDFNVIYANESAWSENASRWSDHQAKCYEAFAHRNDPCGTCPATKLYESSDVRSVACSSGGDGTACGMHQAFPLVSSSGEVESLLVLFKVPTKSAKQTSGEHVEVKYGSKLGELGVSSFLLQSSLFSPESLPTVRPRLADFSASFEARDIQRWIGNRYASE